MTVVKHVLIDGQLYGLTISDEEEALSAAAAAGGVILGIWDRNRPEQRLGSAAYLVENLQDVTECLAEQVVRRHLGLPWRIAMTKRLYIREFQTGDASQVPAEECLSIDDRIFCQPDLLEAYRKNQYVFYEYGIWAVIELSTGMVTGKAGITDLVLEDGAVVKEIGYHIFRRFQNQGYGIEAVRAVIEYADESLGLDILYARIDPSNERSVRLAGKLGFKTVQTDSGSGHSWRLYALRLRESQEEGDPV